MRVRNWLYDTGRAASHAVAVPVVCIGNLTLGGTGKTPLVEWIARRLRERDVRVSIVSRGYGVEAGARNDEAIELEEKLPDVPHLQNVDRVEGARMAIEEFESQVVLLDDGFQHRRLRRDLDVVLIDALEPFGFGHVFPRGLLREPLAGLKRAGVVVLSRADLVEPAERSRIREVVRRYEAGAAWCEVRHAPRSLLDSAGAESSLETLRGRRVLGFCGIGNPEGFRRTLAGLGCELVAFREFADHHAYERADVDMLAQAAREAQAEMLVCTHKDLVKLRLDLLAGKPLKAVVVGVEFLSGEADLLRRLEQLLPAAES
ncbi:MAG: tetraacyldisaccharide 4'-kinase [Planctomycetia bacterium]|nr:tetraacyldisaccharide 4'-kinase [Planctomycetia bacterium]